MFLGLSLRVFGLQVWGISFGVGPLQLIRQRTKASIEDVSLFGLRITGACVPCVPQTLKPESQTLHPELPEP